jgi:hypothetical protein
MKLSKKEAEKLKELDIVKATHEAREECSQLINDQGTIYFFCLMR